MKTCRKCEAEKHCSEFYKRNSNKDGLDNTCKACVLQDAAAKYAASPEKKRAVSVAWAKANPDRKRANNAAWVKANPEKHKASRGAPKPGRMKARYAANPEKFKAYNAAWSQANPEIRRVINQNRRAKKQASGGKISSGLSATLFKLQKGMCPCCAQPLGDNYHLDHKTPLALGGSNSDENMQLLRATCNLQKGAMEPVAFMQSRGFLL